MASTYTTLVGAPPLPKTFAFRDWYYRLLALRISYSAKTRATNYYFAQAGNDSTGNGSQGSPYMTLAKAQALITASTGNIGVFFKRGDTWTETAGINDGGLPNVTIGAWGNASTAKPILSGASASQSSLNGVTVWGDGAWVDGLHVTNWGTTSSANYPIEVTAGGTNAVLVSNCDTDTGGYHCIACNQSTGSGGIVTVVACTAGGVALSTGTPFVAFAANGGMEFIFDSCVATSGSGATANGTYGVYSHTNTGTMALGIVNRLYCPASTNAVSLSVGFGDGPAASSPTDVRTFEIDTYQEMASGNAVQLGPGANSVRINGVYLIQPPDNSSRQLSSGVSNVWNYNTTYIIDGTNVPYSGNYFAWWNANGITGGTDSNFQMEHTAILYQNWGSTEVGFEYYTMAGWGGASYGHSAALQNCIIAAVLGQAAVQCGIGGTLSNGNAYFGLVSGGQFAADPHPIQLADIPQIFGVPAAPTAVSQLYQTSQPPADGVVLEYDAKWQPRNRAGQNVGPIEIVSANQLQAAQLVQIIANTENCCGGGSSSGAFATTINVTDGSNSIPGATVRISGAQSAGAVSTNTAGNASFALNSGSITVATTATGYAGSASVHTIDNLGHWDATGSATLSISLASAGASLSPGAGQTTAYLTTRDGQGEPIAGVTLTFSLIDPQASADSFDQSTFTATSDQAGLLQVLLRQSSTYQARLPAGPWTTFTTGTGTNFPLPEFLGTYTD